MSSKTKAQLQAEVTALREANTKLRAVNRSWFSAGMFENTRKRTDKDPDWNSTSVRFIVPNDLRAGDPLWVDLNLRVYDAETCPLKFDEKKTLPDYVVGIRACSPNWAAQQEQGYIEATAS